jgi:PITH domain
MEMFPNAGSMGGAAAPEAAAPVNDGKMIDLRDKIEKSGCYARNEAAGFPMSNLFIGDSILGCKSDTDEQLILHIAFSEFVKVRTIEFTEFSNGTYPELNPSKILLYVNRDNLGFEDCEDVEPTQTLHLTSEDMKKPIQLKYVKYQRVKSLTLFIEDNQGGDITALGGLKLFGYPVESTNMNDFKKQQQQV